MSDTVVDTVRSRCLKNIQAKLQAIQGGQNNALLTFSQVELGPIISAEAGRKRAVAGIVPGHEAKNVQFPLTYALLPVAVEFKVTWNPGDPPSEIVAEMVMADIQTAILADIYLGGNAVDCQEVGNEIALDIFSDKVVSGVVHFRLHYRHATNDPRQAV